MEKDNYYVVSEPVHAWRDLVRLESRRMRDKWDAERWAHSCATIRKSNKKLRPRIFHVVQIVETIDSESISR